MNGRDNAMRDGTDEHRLNRSARALFDDLTRWAHGRALDRGSLAAIQELADRHRDKARAVGIDFPDLVVMVFPDRRGGGLGIELIRRDIEAAGMAVHITNLIHKYPGITPREIKAAIAQAFPGRRFEAIGQDAHDKASIAEALRKRPNG